MQQAFGILGACLTLAAGLAQAEPAHDLFTGQNATAADGRIARFACHSCHGRDGRGGTEGDVPDISGSALLESTDLRPAYSLTQFRDALTGGVNPEGRSLNRIMPRYGLSDAEVSLLWQYLQDLPRLQAKGITPDRVRFGVVIDPAFPTLGARYLSAFKQELARVLPSGAIHGRKIEVMALDQAVAQADQVIAALAMPPHQDAQVLLIRATGLPVIFGLTALSGREDNSIQRSFVPTDRDINRAIAAHIATTGARSIGIFADTDRTDALSFLIGLEMPDAVVGPVERMLADGEPPDVVIDLDGHLPNDLHRPTVLYRLASQARAPVPAERTFLVIEAPHLIELAVDEDLHPLEAHATLSARIIAKVLGQTGRDLSRTRFLLALEETSLGLDHLDYARLPLNGSDYVAIVEHLNVDN